MIYSEYFENNGSLGVRSFGVASLVYVWWSALRLLQLRTSISTLHLPSHVIQDYIQV